jgi:hypothetical protein
MRNFNPYDIDIDSIKPSRRITDEAEILKYRLARELNKILEHMETEDIVEKTGLDPADVSRIRMHSLGRFTTDRIIKIIYKLDHKLDFKIVKNK